MLKTVTPEQAGISSELVSKFIKTLESRGLVMHSVLLMKGYDIFGEYYWKPFHKDFCHRMYSQTKSYVGVAIGLLEEEGKLNLDDPIAKYFPEKIERELPPYLEALTIKEMLTMQTCGDTPSWFSNEDHDRTHLYLNQNDATRPSGMFFSYDSPGSQVLCSLVEKLAGKSLLDYMKEKIFNHMGTFQTAYTLMTKNNDTFGDSALLCTTRDMASFGKFVMNYGTWNGMRLMNEEYLKTATSPIVANNEYGFDTYYTQGYGYQIWCTLQGGFSFNGMGCQLTVCIPDKDLIFTCTADNQGFTSAKALILSAFFELIADNISDKPLPENTKAYNEAVALQDKLDLFHVKGKTKTSCTEKINGKTFICNENVPGFKEFSFRFGDDNTAELHYTNAQGKKVIRFGLSKNVFDKFPEEGYSTQHAGLPNTEGYLYDCAASAAWTEENKLFIKVQAIDDYFGNMGMTFSFKDDIAYVVMVKIAEAFMDTYRGRILAKMAN